MRRMNSMGWGQGTLRGALVGAAFLLATIFLAAAQAAATPANFDSFFGFQEEGLGALPSGEADFGNDDFLTAGQDLGMGSLNVTLGNMDICIFVEGPGGSTPCQSNTTGITGAYSGLVTVTVSAVDPSVISGPFTLFLNSLCTMASAADGPCRSETTSFYSTNEVTVELNPTLSDLPDVSGIDGFGFAPLVHIVDVTDQSMGFPDLHYVGWEVVLGQTFSFRFDVLSAPEGRHYPTLHVNALGRSVIPEPSTAMLMGLGLALLATGERRFGRESD